VCDTGRQDVERPDDVDFSVHLRFADADRNAGLGCLMADRRRPECRECFFHRCLVTNVAFEEIGVPGHVFAAAGNKTVQNGNVPAFGDGFVGNVAADQHLP